MFKCALNKIFLGLCRVVVPALIKRSLTSLISAALLHNDLLRLGVGKAGGSKLPQDTPTTETFKGKGLE